MTWRMEKFWSWENRWTHKNATSEMPVTYLWFTSPLIRSSFILQNQILRACIMYWYNISNGCTKRHFSIQTLDAPQAHVYPVINILPDTGSMFVYCLVSILYIFLVSHTHLCLKYILESIVGLSLHLVNKLRYFLYKVPDFGYFYFSV